MEQWFLKREKGTKMCRKNKLIAYLIITVLLILGVWISIGGFPMIVTRNDFRNLQNNTTDPIVINPIIEYDLSKGSMEIVLIMSADDIVDLPIGMSKRRVLYCDDKKTMKKLQHLFSFEKLGGDMATVESELLVFYNDTMVYSTNIVLEDNHIGIQNEDFGYGRAINPTELKDIFVKFKPYRKMVLFY